LSVAEAAPAIVGAVRSGEAVVVYVTGLGATSPPVAAGLAAPTVPLAQTVVLPSVSVSGQAATVFFSGLVPGLVGLYQINALPPEGLQAAAAIVVTSGGKASAPFLLEH
jgi:uncharacterized protein (TIGR03437 family)